MKLNSILWFFIITVVLSVGFPPDSALANNKEKSYRIDYNFDFLPEDKRVLVTIRLSKNAGVLKSLRFNIKPEYHSQFEGDGKIKRQANYITWYPPQKGGRLTYQVKIDRQRNSGGYGAYFAKDWVIFRGDHVVPSVKVMTRGKAESQARLRFNMPAGWVGETIYESADKINFVIDDPHRRFDRPLGWMIVGDIGIRKEQIKNTLVAVAGPKEQGIRRMDALALLNWNLPELLAVFPNYYKKILIVSADSPMWRGGLSGPGSLYMHKDRPMIGEDGTSTLIHELIHTAMRINGGEQDDWIVEGFAEFYSLELMRRSGTIPQQRYELTLSKLYKRGADIKKLRGKNSKGATTARAVLFMKELDDNIRAMTHNKASLDDVAKKLALKRGQVSLKLLRSYVKEVAGAPLDILSKNNPLLSD
ncbi:MAG: hypothetical protein GXP14_09750 [Gammaproteobacteria bacterium]|nr:hypothetical protein [Gammaproteobacteria bacterium]